jgi:glycosyltransferase involved in cell wall biosynthesis
LSRLLIITAWYAPLSHPRPHRWTAIAEAWAAAGHEVHVVTARQAGLSGTQMEHGVVVHRVGFEALKSLIAHYLPDRSSANGTATSVQAPGLLTRIGIWAYRTFWQGLYFPDDACIWHRAAFKKAIQLLDNQHFDGFVSVSYPFTSHLIGGRIKRQYPHLRWLADMGDPLTGINPPINRWKQRSRHEEHQILAHADATIVTTEATRRLFEAKYDHDAVAKVHIIGPLLHPVPSQDAPNPYDDGCLHVGYFGAMYRGVRPPDALLDWLGITPISTSIKVHLYGEPSVDYVAALQTDPRIIIEGRVSRIAAQTALQRMDFLLHLGNTTPHQLPSKAIEYMASGVPVIHLSQCDNDAFEAFWGDEPGLFVLDYRSGKYDDAQKQRWLTFLESQPTLGGGVKRYFNASKNHMLRVQQHTIVPISTLYLDCLFKR